MAGLCRFGLHGALMKVRHFSFDRKNGGAFIACDRLDRALLGQGVDSAIITPEIIERLLPTANPRLRHIVESTKSALWASVVGDRTYLSNTLFSLCVHGETSFGAENFGSPNILHFHWVTFLLNPASIASLAHLRSPLVWTLHDANAFTGGCHYPAGCNAFTDGCLSCPQITKSEARWTEFAVRAKRKALIDFPRIVVTAPSNWLLQMARRSPVFAGYDFRVMKNCIPRHFHAQSRDEARVNAGLETEDIGILFAAIDLTENRKGFSLAIEALQKVVLELEQSGQQKLVSRLRPLSLGRSSDCLKSQLGAIGLSVRDFSYAVDEAAVANAYRAADFVVLPSLEDNFPNVITEAAACGATLLGLPCAGPGEIIPALGVGAVANDVSVSAYAALLKSALTDAATWRERARSSSERIARDFSEACVARDFLSLYEECQRTANEDGRLIAGPTAADVCAPGSATLALADSFFKTEAAHPPSTAVVHNPVPEFDLLRQSLLSLRGRLCTELVHLPDGASLVVVRLTNLRTLAPGAEIRMFVSNHTEIALSAWLALGNTKGKERLILPENEAILSLPLEVSQVAVEADDLRLLVRNPTNYGLIAKSLSVHEIAVIGTDEAGEEYPYPRAGAQLWEPDRRTRISISSNLYAAERYLGVTASWLGPERDTSVMLHSDPGRSALILLHLVEKAFPGTYHDVMARFGIEASNPPIDVLPAADGHIVAYEWASEGTAAMRAFSVGSPVAHEERPSARALSVMARSVVVLPHRPKGGISVLRSGIDMNRLAWSDHENIACVVRLSNDGYLLFEAEGLVLATGRLTWSVATDLLAPDQLDVEAGCWLARFVKPTPLSYTINSTATTLDLQGTHDFANTCCFRGLSFRLRDSRRSNSTVSALMQRRVFVNVAAELYNK
jgi:glycosyltransferase involved in cell wall biosynthesis